MKSLSGFKFLLSTPTGSDTPFQSAMPDSAGFSVIGGMQTNGMNLSASGVDITNKSSSEWRELLDRRGVCMLSVSGNGIMDDTNLKKDLETTFVQQKLRWFRIQREDGREYFFKGKLTTFNASGPHDGPLAFNLSIESSGGITIKDAGGFTYNGSQRKITAFSNLLSQYDYITAQKYASPSYKFSEIPDTTDRTERMRRFLNLQHGLPATLKYSNNIFSATVPGAGNQNALIEYVRLTGTTPQSEPDRGKWRVTFDLLRTQNPFAKNIKALRIAIGNNNPTTIPLIADNVQLRGQPAFAFISTNALNRDPTANLNDIPIQYNFVFTDDTSAYEEINLLNADKAVGRAGSITLRGRAVANRFSFPFLFLKDSEVDQKMLQFLDSLSSNVSSEFIYLGDKLDDTGVKWRAFYLNLPLGSAETYDTVVQIGN